MIKTANLFFQIAYCRQKRVEATEGNDQPPDPDFDCHVSHVTPTLNEDVNDQLRKAQVRLP